MGGRGPTPDPHSGRSERRGVVASGAKGKVPKMPKHLEPSGQSLWRRVVSGLKDRKAIGSLHIDALTDACDLADEIDSLKQNIRAHGSTYVGPNMAECERPESKMLDRKRTKLLAYMREFGLTPAADERLRGAPPEEKEEDPLTMLHTMKASRN
jgi:P27 family predicted phage terminase small subunit